MPSLATAKAGKLHTFTNGIHLTNPSSTYAPLMTLYNCTEGAGKRQRSL
ncbi:hypothetical protein JNM87_01300 [Candidatus Saccharibacteria bacterium]|nr:hypothetical protein [Candidatus Saccharibacteria bacterium]